ncbi:SatD family protein [Algoriphagus terrigena]|uniref:SatD family protein n=1 Tax=Algoriphagus terrigena TaxID=344884 RepID=UPI00041CCE2D|nr:SatD family protein [Algoriphagus terrigena]
MRNWILMGDIVGSSDADQFILQQNFAKLVKKVNEDYPSSFESPLTITLGDEFQGIVRSEKDAAEVVIALEEYRWDLEIEILIRYSLGLGEISTPINPQIAYGMLGPGLSEVREALTEMKEGEDRMMISGELDTKMQMKLAMNIFLEKQEEWKWKDREIISGYFHYRDYKKVAEVMGKDVSLIWRRFKSLGFESYLKRKKLVRLIYAAND